jgi:hypothetical protein
VPPKRNLALLTSETVQVAPLNVTVLEALVDENVWEVPFAVVPEYN